MSKYKFYSRYDSSKVVFAGDSLIGADLYRADLSGDDLSGASLYRADLSEADLSGANLSGADLSGANLYRAALSEADLSGANLYRASTRFTEVLTFTLGEDYGFYHHGDQYPTGHYVKVGCEGRSLKHWLEHYREIGEYNRYDDNTIELYGDMLKILARNVSRKKGKLK